MADESINESPADQAALDSFRFHVNVKLRKLFEDPANPHPGENLFQALKTCFRTNLPPPAWVKEAFLDGYYKYREYLGTTEEAFRLEPRPQTKKSKRLAIRRRRNIQGLVWQLVKQFHDAGEPICDCLFEKVGNHDGIYLSSAEVKRLYYDYLAGIKESEKWIAELKEYIIKD